MQDKERHPRALKVAEDVFDGAGIVEKIETGMDDAEARVHLSCS